LPIWMVIGFQLKMPLKLKIISTQFYKLIIKFVVRLKQKY
jgi:hypothetical protein